MKRLKLILGLCIVSMSTIGLAPEKETLWRGVDALAVEHSNLNAGNQQWGTGDMQHDITDGVQYLMDQGIADPERIGIVGFSYGGYATLAGLAFTPDLYAAGVSIAGPSNIVTLLEATPPYWVSQQVISALRVGDIHDPGDRARLEAQSPLFSAEHIRAPLMVIQGANDPRVPQEESDQMVATLQDLSRPVEYLLASDEGHGFVQETNIRASITALERFLAEHLGGRYQADMSPDIAAQLDILTMDRHESMDWKHRLPKGDD